MNFLAKIYFCVLCMLILSCCNHKDTPDPEDEGSPSDRELMLTHYADHIVLPGYAAFKVKLDSLANKTTYFNNSPTNQTLVDLRNAWIDAYKEWQKVELFDFGPGYDYALRNYYNIYPTSEAGINSNIALIGTGGTPNLEVPAAYPQQGFPALDYLMNGLAATDNDILALYTTAGDAASRKNYLTMLISQMKSKFNQVSAQWTGGYRATFISKTSMDISSSTSQMVNGFVLNYERYIRAGKFGIPAGVMSTTPYPEKVESFYYKDLSLILAKEAHQASIDFFNGVSRITGTEGPSLKTYLNSLDAKDSMTGTSLVEAINAQFTVVETKLDALGSNLYQEIQTNTTAVVDTYNELQKEVRLLKVDMTSALSITITYTDNDGD